MNELTSRSRGTATPEERGQDGRRDPLGDGARSDPDADRGRPRGHHPVPGTIDVDGAPMAVDRCRYCGTVVVDPRRPGGPCPGPNHTLAEFGIVPPAGREHEPALSTLRSDPRDHHDGYARNETVSTPLPR